VTPSSDPIGVLVVDDDDHVRNFLALWLRLQGFSVWAADGAEEALKSYRRQGDAITLVLLDVHMPGLDGSHLLGALKQLDPQVRCCFMSGDLGWYTEEGLLQLGAERVFMKPFSPADLVQHLRAGRDILG
jgi:DNA-binding response OmpR family regulator